MILPLQLSGDFIPIKLPIYQPVPSKVHKTIISDEQGNKLADLTPVADIEAICLRHQKDSAPFRYLRVLLATGRILFAKNFCSQSSTLNKFQPNFGRKGQSRWLMNGVNMLDSFDSQLVYFLLC